MPKAMHLFEVYDGLFLGLVIWENGVEPPSGGRIPYSLYWVITGKTGKNTLLSETNMNWPETRM